MKTAISCNDGRETTDRRKYPRFSINADYILVLDGIEHKGVAINMSLGGAYLATIEPTITEDNLFQEGELSLNANNKSLLMRCYVTYIGTQQNEYPIGVGIAFIENDEMNTLLITEFISS
ncbi:PilZ domain-containing protein [Methylovulum psychrotolerans]|uniref:PilZ domain-containing protein n=1 Tax=Methylovulum psychrotolerans TaxID=1704499 RepID=A0A1Z4BVT2_9GAMM|nr:PilZ domain-containing protein [Methylovulum psychrotolerans]ASF45319.1 hypothetical protein CEK71_04130 [Methylovulum psychrotolerans]